MKCQIFSGKRKIKNKKKKLKMASAEIFIHASRSFGHGLCASCTMERYIEICLKISYLKFDMKFLHFLRSLK